MQSSSHSCPRETSDPVCKSSKMKAFLSGGDSSGTSGTSACFVGVIIAPLITTTSGPTVFLTLVHIDVVLLCKNVWSLHYLIMQCEW